MIRKALILLMLAAVGGALAGDREVWGIQSFEDDDIVGWRDAGGSAPSGFSVVSGGLNGSDYAVQATLTTQSPATASGYLRYRTSGVGGQTSGIVTVYCSMTSPGESERGLTLMITDLTLPYANYITQIRFSENDQIQYLNSSDSWTNVGVSWSTSTEYDFEVIIDMDDNDYDIWIDGEEEQTTLAFNDSIDQFGQVAFSRVTNSVPSPATVKLDDVRVETTETTDPTNGTQAHYLSTGPGPLTEKPRSPMFYAEDELWAVLFDGQADGDVPNAGGFYVYQYDSANLIWTSKSDRLTTDADFAMDAFYDETNLFVAGGHASQNYMWKLTYSGARDWWSINTSTTIAGAQTPTGVNPINISLVGDGSSRLWHFSFQDDGADGSIDYEARNKSDLSTVSGSWPQTFSPTATLDEDDLMMAVQFNDGTASIGIMYSDQDNDTMYFTHRHDSDGTTTWQSDETIMNDTDIADDHASIVADTNGELYAVWKTSLNGTGDDNIMYSNRSTGGSWSTPNVVWVRGSSEATEYTRPRIAYDATNDDVYVFATLDTAGGNIYYKTSDAGSVSFGSEVTVFSGGGNDYNDVTAPPGELTDTTDLHFLAIGDDNYLYYDSVDLAAAPVGARRIIVAGGD